MNTFKKIWIQLDPNEQNEIRSEVWAQIKDVKGGNQEERIRRSIKKLVFFKKIKTPPDIPMLGGNFI